MNGREPGFTDSRSALLQAADECIESLRSSLISLRRELHRHPEVGWTEFQTTAKVVERLRSCNCRVIFGPQLYGEATRLGLPDESLLESVWDEANDQAQQGHIDAEILRCIRGGYTGALAIWDTGVPGPTVAFRVDIDGLPVTEAQERDHRPTREGWRSRRDGVMHACGHDGHTAIGLSFAEVITRLIPHLRGKMKLFFQPAEEGGRGAAPLVAAGHFDDVDDFVALHLGLGAPEGSVATGAGGFFATTKHRVTYLGTPAHAGKAPEQGRNALLAAATAALNLHTLTQFSGAETRLNVGLLRAGTAVNIVPPEAEMVFEVRAATAEVHRELEKRALRAVKAAAEIHGVECRTKPLGGARSVTSDGELAHGVASVLGKLRSELRVTEDFHFGASEDATLMMERVQGQGGRATLGIIGTDLPGDHHQPTFDVSDDSLTNGLSFLTASLLTLAGLPEEVGGRPTNS